MNNTYYRYSNTYNDKKSDIHLTAVNEQDIMLLVTDKNPDGSFNSSGIVLNVEEQDALIKGILERRGISDVWVTGILKQSKPAIYRGAHPSANNDEQSKTDHVKPTSYRIKIVGSFDGTGFTYEDKPGMANGFWHPEFNDPSSYWWKEGNMACDCSRFRFLPDDMKSRLTPEEMTTCGCRIIIKTISSVDNPDIPTMELNEQEDILR